MPEVALPAKCFISHAYADAVARDALIKRLPAGVTPFVFPPITFRPDEFVSEPLIEAELRVEVGLRQSPAVRSCLGGRVGPRLLTLAPRFRAAASDGPMLRSKLRGRLGLIRVRSAATRN
jgi:hypothetical protein